MTTRHIAMGLALVLGMVGQAGAMKYRGIGKEIATGLEKTRAQGIQSKQRHYKTLRKWEKAPVTNEYVRVLNSIENPEVKELIHHAVYDVNISTDEKASAVENIVTVLKEQLPENASIKKIAQVIGAMGRGLRKSVNDLPPIPAGAVFKE